MSIKTECKLDLATIGYHDSKDRLSDVLAASGYALNTLCANRGLCGGCRVNVLIDDGIEPVLACQIACEAIGDRVVEIPIRSIVGTRPSIVSDFKVMTPFAHCPVFQKEKFGIAIDIGTTTVAAILVDLEDGKILGTANCFNEQICGADFGTQESVFFSAPTIREIWLPYYKQMNDWIHTNTEWKTFKHSCGAIEPLLNTLIDCGFDIINPVQCSASGMEPEHIKKAYGDRICFWGGGCNTQQTLPFGTPDSVRQEVLKRCEIFAAGGGFVFDSIHNVQALTSVDNFVAMIEAVHEFNEAGA